MTLRIEPARKHGPFDPRWLSARLKKREQSEGARTEAVTPAAVQAAQKGVVAVLPTKRRANPERPALPDADVAGVGGPVGS